MYVSPNIDLASVASAANLATANASLVALTTAVPLAEQRKLIAGGPGTITLPDGAAATVMTNGAANVYGAWAQISPAVASNLLCLGVTGRKKVVGGNSSYGQMQIGVGAGGAEVVQATIPISWMVGANAHPYIETPLLLPLPIATGVRVAVRSRTNYNSTAEQWQIMLTLVDPANVQKWSA